MNRPYKELFTFFSVLLIYPMISYFLINKEFIGLRLFFNVDEHKLFLIAITGFVVSYLLLLKFNKNYLFFFKIDNDWRLFSLLAFTWCIFFVFHEIIFQNNGISIKYAMYLFILLLIITKNGIRLDAIAKMLIIFSFILSFLAIFQNILLLILFDNDLSSFDDVTSVRENILRVDAVYKNPFGFGLVRNAINVNYWGFEFKRSLLFTTEPKYASAWISVMIVATFVFIKNNLKYFLIITFTLALIAIHSYSELGIVLLTIISFVFRKIIYIFPKIFCLLFVAIIPSIYGALIFLEQLNLPKFIHDRVLSGLGGREGQSWNFFESGLSIVLARLLSIYGPVGFLLQWGVFITFCYISTKTAKSSKHKFTELIFFYVIYTYFVFWIFILPEQITPLLVFLIVSTHHLWHRQKRASIVPSN